MPNADHRPHKDSVALEFLRSARGLRGLSESQIDRIESRLSHPPRRRFPAGRLAFCASVALLLLGGAAVASGLVRVPWLSGWFPSRSLAPKGVKGAAPGSASRGARSRPSRVVAPQPEPLVAPLAPTPSAPPIAPMPDPVRRARPGAGSPSDTARRTPGTVPPPLVPTPPTREAPAESPLLVEGRSFAGALAIWHRERDSVAALAALDAHDRRFGDGQMRWESRLLRAEILLSLRRDREAMRILDRVPLAGLPRERELRTVRGELRIKYGRCAEGRADLAVVLASDNRDGFGKRAAHAAALCP